MANVEWPAELDDLEDAGYEYSGPGQCKSCARPVLWMRTPSGARMPLEEAEMMLERNQVVPGALRVLPACGTAQEANMTDEEKARELAIRINQAIDHVRTKHIGYLLGVGPRDAYVLTTDARFFAWLATAPPAAHDAIMRIANLTHRRPSMGVELGRFSSEMVDRGLAVEVAVHPNQPEVTL